MAAGGQGRKELTYFDAAARLNNLMTELAQRDEII